jgi:Cysteine-rich secretory protein family
MRLVFLAVIALVSTAAPAQPAANAPAIWLEVHNRERAQMGVPPLVWDEALAARAAAWAQELARTDRFDHADQKQDGENLWIGTLNAYPPAAMVQAWIDEKVMFRPGRFPDVSTTKQWRDVGHYTQLIWYSSKRLGCGLASNASDSYLVCRYGPPGNWLGESPLGVPPLAIRKAKPHKRGRIR